MVRNPYDLTQIFRRYRMRVIRINRQDDCYLIETNRGTKELREWPRVDVLRWSFSWREQMARQGHRDVERFIRTRDAKPYVIINKKGYTLTDHLPASKTEGATAEQIRLYGRMAGWMHTAQSSHPFPYSADLFRRELTYMKAEQEKARSWHHLLSRKDHFASEDATWVAHQLAPLLERMERSVQLLSSPQLNDDFLTVSHSRLGWENWSWHNDKWILRGFYAPALSIQHRDTASFLRDLYLDSGDFHRVDAFLDGYEENRRLRYEEYLLILSFLLFPGSAWSEVEQYLAGHATGAEAFASVQEAFRQQQKLDPLLRHLAARADQARSVRVR